VCSYESSAGTTSGSSPSGKYEHLTKTGWATEMKKTSSHPAKQVIKSAIARFPLLFIELFIIVCYKA